MSHNYDARADEYIFHRFLEEKEWVARYLCQMDHVWDKELFRNNKFTQMNTRFCG